MSAENTAVRADAPARKLRGYEVGVPNESCSAEMLGLARFASAQKFFASDQKSPTERVLNPFGDPWASRKRNPYISVMTGSCRGILRRKAPVVPHPVDSDGAALADYANYARLASSTFHYDETDGRLMPNMPRFRDMKTAFRAAGLKRTKFIAYTVANFDDGLLFARDSGVPESAYVHFPETSVDPADRLHFYEAPPLDAGGFVFDIRKPEVREMIALAIAKAMSENDVDAVLIDYAVRAYAFGLPSLIDTLPEDWIDSFQHNQRKLLQRIHAAVRGVGKQLFLNGMMLDGLAVTEPGLIAVYGKCADGVFWEQPFRWEWRGYSHAGADYYQRLGQFFDVMFGLRKQLIVKIGTYRFHATEDIEHSWTARFGATDHGIERHLASYFTAFFLLYGDRRWSHLFYTHPTELADIFSSEAYFQIWDQDLGEPISTRIEISPHVHMRAFQKGVVFVNNTLEPARLSEGQKPAAYKDEYPSLELAPLSGTFWRYKDGRPRSVPIRLRELLRPRRRLMALRLTAAAVAVRLDKLARRRLGSEPGEF
jgi:hypothetical protein